MSEMKTLFEKSKQDVMGLKEKPGNDVLLELYALNKQAELGDADVHGEKPALFDFVGAAKYNAWEKKKGMVSEEAMQKYVDLVNELLSK